MLYDADGDFIVTMPGLNELRGPVPHSVSVARAGAKEDDMYIMHGVTQDLSSDSRFDVLRFDPLNPWCDAEDWYWRSLPLPPFVHSPKYKPALVSSYTVVDGGHTICLSSVAEGIGTYCFDTVSCEWRCVGDWVLPFNGRAEYIPDYKLWLGFSLCNPGHLCATSGLSDMLVDQRTTSLIVWQDHTPKEWRAVRNILLNLGSGKFAIAKVFKVARDTAEPGFISDWDMAEDEFVFLTGMELGFSGDDDDIKGLKIFEHKSIQYMCANNTIRFVL